jgi:hypothetical protein
VIEGHLLGDLQGNVLLRLAGGRAQMRGDDDILQPEQHVLLGRLDREDVEGGTGETARFDRPGDRRLVDQPAACTVDQPRAGFHCGNPLGGQDIGGLVGLGQVQRDEIGAREEIADVLDLLHPQFARLDLREERVEGDHLHLQPDGAAGNHRADIAAADQAQGLAGDLDPHEGGFLPLARMGRGVGLGDHPGGGEQHGDGVLGGGDRVAKRGVHHHDALGRGGGEVNIIDPDPGAADDLQVIGFCDDIGGSLGGGPHRQTVILANDLGQPSGVLAQIGLEVGLDAAIAEDRDRLIGKLVGNQDFGHFGGHWFAPNQGGQTANCAALAVAKAQSSQGVSASISAVSTVAPHQMRRPGGASR